VRSPPSRARSRASLAAVAACGALAACAGGSRPEPFSTVSLDEVEAMLGAPGVLVVDANSSDTYAKGHLPGAVHYRAKPLPELLPAERDARLVFYCASPS
jgi:hypothetical protein